MMIEPALLSAFRQPPARPQPAYRSKLLFPPFDVQEYVIPPAGIICPLVFASNMTVQATLLSYDSRLNASA